MEAAIAMNVDFSRTLVPAHDMIRPVLAVQQRGLVPFSQEDRPRGAIRFVGYGGAGERCIYGTAGRPIHESPDAGALLDIYV
ncbi:MAG: hypothetical protein JXL84_12925 [Deltaproteobacteria bacterium]|nr:hypothetical protein [Deltaproteobacteria bacterium]